MPVQSLVIRPRGPFSLAESATFGFGQRDEGSFDGVMRLAFGVDGYDRHAGVELRQDDAGLVRGVVGDLYGLGAPATPDQLRQLAEPWRPFRTWAAVLIRAVTPRLTATQLSALAAVDIPDII